MTTHSQSGGFSLVEVALALGIAAVCLVAVLGLLPIGVNTNRTSLEQARAASVAATVAADLRGTTLAYPAAAQTTAYYRLTIPASPAATVSAANTHTLYLREDGTPASANAAGGTQDQALDVSQNPRYRATVFFTAPTNDASGTATRNAMTARVLVTWPAAADPSPAATPSHFSGSFETLTSLTRN